MGFIHIILALVLRPIVGIISVPYTFVKLLFTGRIGELLHWLHQLAFMIDLFGNYLIKYAGTDTMLKSDAVYKYGRNIKTISHITAYNYKYNKLTWFGRFVAYIMILCKDKAFNK
jgi:hypothetical protein